MRTATGIGSIADLRPIRAVLTSRDYWCLQEHRRRCEDIDAAMFMRLARLIRAKMEDATVLSCDEITPDTVTGSARVTYLLDQNRPKTRRLYHWGYPDRARNRLPVCTFLGITLIGMSAGQRAKLINANGIAGELQVLAVHSQVSPEAHTCDWLT